VRNTFRGGVHPEERKELSREARLRLFNPKGEMVFPLQQHIGKPAKPLVQKGDTVLVGQRIAEADGFISAHIHSSCSGKVKAIEKRRVLGGGMIPCIVIDNDGEFTPFADYTHKDKNSPSLSITMASLRPLRTTPIRTTNPLCRTTRSSAGCRRPGWWAWAARDSPPA